jgi:hypothetical protein
MSERTNVRPKAGEPAPARLGNTPWYLVEASIKQVIQTHLHSEGIELPPRVISQLGDELGEFLQQVQRHGSTLNG